MYLVLTVASLLSVFPLYYMFCASTNRSIDVIAGKLIPGTYLMENFKSLIAQQNLRLALWNSFRNATVLTVLCLLVCSIAGYGFEIYHDKAKDAVFTVLLTAMMITARAVQALENHMIGCMPSPRRTVLINPSFANRERKIIA